MSYKENPKFTGSGILACVPQKGTCPIGCKDCFFTEGKSYLSPLVDNLPNLPPVELGKNHVVRVNDGNDSNVDRETVMKAASVYPMKFYNTAIPILAHFDAPVVLTLNPGKDTDIRIHFVSALDDLKKLMFVRFRVNAWNLSKCDLAVEYYAREEIPIVLTFMAYNEIADIPEEHQKYYIDRKRTLNNYWAITTAGWEMIMSRYKYNKWVYSCGKVEGELGKPSCRFCGNCLREYFAAMERLAGDKA